MVTVGKQSRKAQSLVNKDDSSEDPNNISHLYSLSDKGFREERWRLFKEFKEIIENQ